MSMAYNLDSSKLQSTLSDIIRQCHQQYVGKGEIATDSDTKVAYLCFILEQILSHGLRNKISFNSNSENIQNLLEFMREFNISNKSKLEFWNCISFIMPRHERERILSLKFICTDVGRGRAWLRSALNERSLERYMKCILCDHEVLEEFYESGAFLRDKEKQRGLLRAMFDLSPMLFSIKIDNPDLNINSTTHFIQYSEPVISSSEPNIVATDAFTSNDGQSHPNIASLQKRKKKPSKSVISFDYTNNKETENDEHNENSQPILNLEAKFNFEPSSSFQGHTKGDLEPNYEQKTGSYNYERSSNLEMNYGHTTRPSLERSDSNKSDLENKYEQKSGSNLERRNSNKSDLETKSEQKIRPNLERSTSNKSDLETNSVYTRKPSLERCNSNRSDLETNCERKTRSNLERSNINKSDLETNSVYTMRSSFERSYSNKSDLGPRYGQKTRPNLERSISNRSNLENSNNVLEPLAVDLENSNFIQSIEDIEKINIVLGIDALIDQSNVSRSFLNINGSNASQNVAHTTHNSSSNVSNISHSFSNNNVSKMVNENGAHTTHNTHSNVSHSFSNNNRNNASENVAHITHNASSNVSPFSPSFVNNNVNKVGNENVGQTNLTAYSNINLNKSSIENEMKRSMLDRQGRNKVGFSSTESLETVESSGTTMSRDNVMSVSGYSENRSISDLSSHTDDGTMSVYSTATSVCSTTGSAANSNDYAGLRILGANGIGELIPITSYIPSNQNDILESDERAIDALYENGLDDMDDSLSICSTSDAGSSSTHPSSSHQNHAKASVYHIHCEDRIQELNRENELLKHQLRKYVTVVQLLKKEQDSNSECQNEALMYEQKLVQLADMHSELLEFNQKLKLSLNCKESIINKLSTEMALLKGHRPSLISLWLPCVFMGGSGTDLYHIYQIHLRLGTEEWNVYRRYSDFYNFNKSIQKSYPSKLKLSNVKFPSRKFLNKGNKNALFIEQRRQKLELYLRHVVNSIIEYNSPSCEDNLNKYILIRIIPFLNDYYASSKTSNIETIKRRFGGNCVTGGPELESREEEERRASLKYTGL